MPLSRKLDYVILDLIESAARTVKTAPLNLGGYGGATGGIGQPPGGYIGWLPQTNVAYDQTEAATLATAPSGFSAPSGWSLLDNLNHIRYRLGTLESGILVVDEYDGSPSVPNTTWITFSGGAEVSQLAPGHVLVNITASGGSGSGISGINIEEDSVLEGTAITVLNFTGPGVDVSVLGNKATITIPSGGSPLTVEESDGSPSIANVDKIRFLGATVTNEGSGDVLVTFSGGASEDILHIYNEDHTPDSNETVFTTNFVYDSGTLRVYYNGLRQRKYIHYLDDVDFVTFSTYFTVPSGESLVVDYNYLESQQIANGILDSEGIGLLDSEGIVIIDSL